MTGKERAALLRAQADWIEKLPEDFYVCPDSVLVYCADKERFQRAVKAIGGAWSKKGGEDYFSAMKELCGEDDAIKVYTNREEVCERVKVGTKVIPAKPELVVPATEERVIDVFEWKCPESVLS